MKLLVMSDLHLEFAPLKTDPSAVQAADAVVLAGDIHKGSAALEWIAEVFGGKPVIYVAGNHEFYSHHWTHTLETLRKRSQDYGIHFLEDGSIELQGVRFLGCTLWSDFEFFGPASRLASMRRFEHCLNDCREISVHALPGASARARLAAADVLHRHAVSRAWLEHELLAKPAVRTVVVTHHAPSRRSVAAHYLEDPLTPGFAVDLPDRILTAPELWIHGHMHESFDYVIGDADRPTRILCNPRGYPRGSSGCENPWFRPDLLVEI